MLRKKTKWGPIGKDVYERTYSRTKSDGTKETWEETVQRVVDGNLSLVDSKYWQKGEREELFDLMHSFKILPAGRHLWVTGVPGRQFLFNCHTAGWDESVTSHYSFTFDELMKGGGVGSNYSNRYVTKYGAVRHEVPLHIVCDPAHADYEKMKPWISTKYHHEWAGCHPVPDTREGWVETLVALLQRAYTQDGDLILDMSRIRPYGAPIRGFGGVASGPAPLAEMLHKVNDLLRMRLGQRLSSLDHMQIDHLIASCVVAGNVRRSARMAIKYWRDPDIMEFINCKKDPERKAHSTTNISVEIDHAFFRAYKRGDEHAKRVYRECIDSIQESGEPGFWNSSLSQVGEVDEVFSTNPCGEISMSMFENCNLGHVNLDVFYDNVEGAVKAFRLMARFLIRATFADITSPLQRHIVNRNRRIGVGFFGFQGWLCKQGIKYSESHSNDHVKKLLRHFYSEIRQEARDYSFQLRIPEPVKVTTVAPTGTIAKLPGKSEGVQAIFSDYFVRRVRFGKDAPQIADLKARGVHIEKCYYQPDSTVVASYYCKDQLVEEMEDLKMEPELVEDQFDLSVNDCLAIQAMVQREFVDNSISYTVNIDPQNTKEDVEKQRKELYHSVMRYLPELKGTTIIVGAGDRPQPPYTRITKEEYEAYTGPKFTAQGEIACAVNACPVK